MRIIKRIAMLLTAVVLATTAFPATVHAQTQTGTVEGKVLDEQGAVLPGATLTLTGARGSQTTVSDAEGTYRFVGVAPGKYSLKSGAIRFLRRKSPRSTSGWRNRHGPLHAEGRRSLRRVDQWANRVERRREELRHGNEPQRRLLGLMPIYSSTSTDSPQQRARNQLTAPHTVRRELR